ncbi:MAG: trypsin-like serine protease [Bdellovibrio sp.]
MVCSVQKASQNQNEIQTEIDAAIINGIKLRDTNKLAKSIVRVNGSMSCTGSLIASDIVITAAHCMYGVSTAEVTFDKSAEEVDTYVGKVLVHENFSFDGDPSEQSDLALIKLDKAAPKNYEPISILKDSSKVSDTTVLHIYGHGASEVRAVKIDGTQYPIAYLNELIQSGLVECNDDKTTCVKYLFDNNHELLRGVTKIVKAVEKAFITSYEALKSRLSRSFFGTTEQQISKAQEANQGLWLSTWQPVCRNPLHS